MGDLRKQHSAAFKSRVAIAAIRGERTMSELSSEYGVHPTVINRWNKQALKAMPQIMFGKPAPGQREQEELVSRLFQGIGQLEVELDWLEKKYDKHYQAMRAVRAAAPLVLLPAGNPGRKHSPDVADRRNIYRAALL